MTKSIDSGIWAEEPTVLIDAPPRSNAEGSEYAALKPESRDLYNRLEERTGYTPGEGAPYAAPFARSLKAVDEASWGHKLTALVFWIFLNLIWFGIFGYALYWFLGASTSVYADLRADVDGTEEDEIYLEEEEEDFETLAKGGPTVPAPEPGAPTTPPPGTVEMPSSAPPAPVGESTATPPATGTTTPPA